MVLGRVLWILQYAHQMLDILHVDLLKWFSILLCVRKIVVLSKVFL